ncbi:hypothetical protein BDP27DRAFT_1429641 [Rhodocollybia butyracea]|uniref:Uncharacterized protein n=1 Tax=Rhodocollybia butyracea TaxID=206335 RepID=A0A9P5TZX7_9AGAR|nr:hypothetical protein BDP27DRAFT_1429641 [Rhodocollybia butyracea]
MPNPKPPAGVFLMDTGGDDTGSGEASDFDFFAERRRQASEDNELNENNVGDTDVWETGQLPGWWKRPELPPTISEQARLSLLRDLRTDWHSFPLIPWYEEDDHDVKYDHLPSEDWAYLQLFLCSEAARKANAGVPTFYATQLFTRIEETNQLRNWFRVKAKKEEKTADNLREQIRGLQMLLDRAERDGRYELAKANRARAVGESLNKLVFLYRTRSNALTPAILLNLLSPLTSTKQKMNPSASPSSLSSPSGIDAATVREYRETVAILAEKIDKLEKSPEGSSSAELIFWKSMRDDLDRLRPIIADLCGSSAS